jgi:pimeloyl-ACP methyl ester carboxylesterase
MSNFRTYGKSPFAVAVIHGGPGGAGEMAPVAQRLSSEQGILEPFQTAPTLEGQIEELRHVLATNAQIPVTLIGYSWGATLSYLVTARYPELVSRLILVSCGGFTPESGKKCQETRFHRMSPTLQTEVLSLFKQLQLPTEPEADQAFVQLGHLFSKLDAFAPLAYEQDEIEYNRNIFLQVSEDLAALRTSGTLLDHAKNIQCPVLAIHGDYDPHPAEDIQQPLSSCISIFKFELLKQCGHKPWIEQHAEQAFYRILIDVIQP